MSAPDVSFAGGGGMFPTPRSKTTARELLKWLNPQGGRGGTTDDLAANDDLAWLSLTAIEGEVPDRGEELEYLALMPLEPEEDELESWPCWL